MFDLREVQRALLLAGLGTVIVIGLFALFVEAHPPADETTSQGIKVAETGSLPATAFTTAKAGAAGRISVPPLRLPDR